jgi:hypothetical protein
LPTRAVEVPSARWYLFEKNDLLQKQTSLSRPKYFYKPGTTLVPFLEYNPLTGPAALGVADEGKSCSGGVSSLYLGLGVRFRHCSKWYWCANSGAIADQGAEQGAEPQFNDVAATRIFRGQSGSGYWHPAPCPGSDPPELQWCKPAADLYRG